MNHFSREATSAVEDAAAASVAPTELLANTAFAKLHSHRLSIRMPNLPSYSVDAVLNIIAAKATPTQCGKYCNQCAIYKEYPQANFPVNLECIETMRRRDHELRYLFKKLVKTIHLGLLQVWNSDFTVSADPPAFDPDDVRFYRKNQYWAKNSYLFPEDLARFCDYERIQLIVYGSELADSPVMASYKVSHEGCRSSPDAGTTPSAIQNSGHEDSSKTKSKAVKQRRFDMIAAEIDEIMVGNPSLTPTQVMKILIGRVGTPDSCVLVNDGDSILWEDSHGKKKRLTLVLLSNRLRRRRGRMDTPIKVPNGEF